MNSTKKIKSALISVYHKDGLDEIIKTLHSQGVKLYSTGGTQSFIESLNIPVTAVESITGYPSILGGRVKTLHPKVFGGILARRENTGDIKQLAEYEIPEIDLVIVDLYPFEATVASGASDEDIIEKIDIGGISLIRGAAKNYNDVIIVPSQAQYADLQKILIEKGGKSDIADRRYFAKKAFSVSSHYDSAIFNYFDENSGEELRLSISESSALRYGENPHQKGVFFGDLNAMFEQLNGKEISYNNLLDLDAAISLIDDFNDTTCAIIKHNNACGLATRPTLVEAWEDALAGDPISAFGGVIITNRPIDKSTAVEMNKIFFDLVLAPSYDAEALELLKSKKNRTILVRKEGKHASVMHRSLLNGILTQDRDLKTEIATDLTIVSTKKPTAQEVEDMLFANKIVKHTKSNAIVLVKNGQLIASGVGQTSRVDALRQSIAKAAAFEFDVRGAVMASDAFFPFPDCVEIADEAGITAVIQPGGSINDKLSIEYCDKHGLAMVTTGIRHFKH